MIFTPGHALHNASLCRIVCRYFYNLATDNFFVMIYRVEKVVLVELFYVGEIIFKTQNFEKEYAKTLKL